MPAQLDRRSGIRLRGLLVFAMTLLLYACSEQPPECPFRGMADRAPSAGCFSVDHGELLLIQGMNGKISPPGGGQKSDESAQCTAFRETWEETGLQLHPAELLMVFDTGFHLYRCERVAHSGSVDPSMQLEVRDAFYLPAARFEDYEWRFEGQAEIFRELLLDELRLQSCSSNRSTTEHC